MKRWTVRATHTEQPGQMAVAATPSEGPALEVSKGISNYAELWVVIRIRIINCTRYEHFVAAHTPTLLP
jgi:hypothetical protein